MAKKTKKKQRRNIKWANLIFIALGVLVALSMIIGSVMTSNPTPAPPPTFALPAVTQTP